MDFLYVFIGGGLGSICRYGITRALMHSDYHLPVATISANILACLVLGVIMGLAQRNIGNETVILLGAIGFCGGFSTFSTFSLENVRLMESGAYGLALLNILVSVIICFFCVFVGVKIAG